MISLQCPLYPLDVTINRILVQLHWYLLLIFGYLFTYSVLHDVWALFLHLSMFHVIDLAWVLMFEFELLLSLCWTEHNGLFRSVWRMMQVATFVKPAPETEPSHDWKQTMKISWWVTLIYTNWQRYILKYYDLGYVTRSLMDGNQVLCHSWVD